MIKRAPTVKPSGEDSAYTPFSPSHIEMTPRAEAPPPPENEDDQNKKQAPSLFQSMQARNAANPQDNRREGSTEGMQGSKEQKGVQKTMTSIFGSIAMNKNDCKFQF